jgi:beta-lactamase class C
MLPHADPETVDINPWRLERAFGILQHWLDEQIVGAVAAVIVRRGMIVGAFYGGHVDQKADAPAVTASSLFHLASIGKPMAALATMLLVEGGEIGLDEPLAAILPEFAGDGRDAITVRQLLAHTSGLAQDPDLTNVPPGSDTAAELRTYLTARPVVPVGSKVEYSNIGYGLLGLIIEKVSGTSFADFMRTRLFGPIGMTDAHLAPDPALYDRIVQVRGTPEPGSPFERFNSAHARRQTHPAGNIIGTPVDVAAFLQLFLNGGRAGGVQVAAPATLRLMTTNQTQGLRGGIEGFMTWEDCAWGLGFDLRGTKLPHYAGELAAPQTFGHTGVAGTFAWADPTRELICVMLANQMLYNRWNTPHWSRFSTAVVASLVG